MSDLKKIALTKAINTLASIGAIYTVEYEGETTSNAPVIEKKRKAYTLSGVKYLPVYKPALDHLESVGDFYELPCPEGMNIEKLRSALCGSLNIKFGSGTTATSVDRDRNVIEIVKV